jgi:hypothetical protein
MSILTLHVQRRDYPRWLTDSMARLAGRVGWIVCIDPPPDRNPFPHQKMAARLWIGGDDVEAGYIRRGAEGASAYYDRIRADLDQRRYVECFLGPNEPGVTWPDDRKRLAEFYVRLAGHYHADGRKLAGPCWSVGWPGGTADQERIPWVECIHRDTREMLPIFEVVDYGCSHNYGKRVGAAWTELDAWTLRFRHVFDALRTAGKRVPPWLITEGGLDIKGDKETSGWLGPDGPSEQQYADQIAFAVQQVSRFPEVQCYAIFTALPTDWVSFTATESLWRRLEALIMAEAITPPQPATPPALSEAWLAEARKHKVRYNPDAGLRKAIEAAGQEVKSNEWYEGDTAYQWGLDVARLMWHLWRWTPTGGVQRVHSEAVTR